MSIAKLNQTQRVPALRPLSPVFTPEQHQDYVDILKTELTKSEQNAPRNIALTGHYGSGKSSVLMETQHVLKKSSLKVINLSLPSLGIGDGRIPEDGNKELDTTNLIQKEIVKQLLYRRKPSDMPASRYHRLDNFRVKQGIYIATGAGVSASVVAFLAKLPEKVKDALPSEAWTWVDLHLWGNPASLIQWSSLLGVFVFMVLFTLWVQQLLQERIRVSELTAGPTKVSLTDSSSSYFDEYLDEIVYFFQTSETSVVIFEDLDRFKDPHIFETLRELNMLLNNADQIKTKPIRFVYAIRDSIFEQLDIETIKAKTDDEVLIRRTLTVLDEEETRRLTSTNRTKFFDLVVPMVPFISHRTSRDLIMQELQSIAVEHRPGKEVVNIVSAHLTDMRLIKNICNEYEVFQRRILNEDGLKELTADRLFSSIVYKNLYLIDYEKIRDGTSSMDTLYRAYREWVAQQITAARNTERRARARLRRLDAISSRAANLGTRLQKVLLARYLGNVQKNTLKITLEGTDHDWDALLQPDFWRVYLHGQSDMSIYYRGHYNNPEIISFEKIQTLMGERLSLSDWEKEEAVEARKEINDALSDQKVIQHAAMSDSLRESERLFSYKENDCSLIDLAAELFEGADLVLELLKEGLIDENFTLYVTQYPGQTISASAMNFIIKAVQPDVMDSEYHFGTGEESDIEDIKSVINAETQRLFGGQSIYNIEIFDYLLAEESKQLDEPIRRLASNAASDTRFIDDYLISGKSASVLVQRLSGLWEGIFDYLLAEGLEFPDQDLLGAAMEGASSKLNYVTNTEQRRKIGTALSNLPMATTPQNPELAASVAKVISQMEILVDDLSAIAEPLRAELSKRNLYPITLTNLMAVLEDQSKLSLDRIKETRKSDVYAYVLDHLDDYLRALTPGTNIPTVVDPNHFSDILSDVAETAIDNLEEVARRANIDCMLSNLDELEVEAWPALVRTHRYVLTAHNVMSYIDQFGVDSDLANWLEVVGEITVNADNSTPLKPLALNLLNATELHDDTALQLVDSLRLKPESIPAESLEKDAHPILPDLVRKGLVSDDADAYISLEDSKWELKKELIWASKNFPSYMTKLALSTKELFQIASGDVPEAVKDVLLTELDIFEPELGPKGATALAEWASDQGRALTIDTIVTIATKGGSESARAVLKLLGAKQTTIDLDLLKSALNALGAPYNQLTAHGTDRPSVNISDGVEIILDLLQEANIVSSFKKDAKRNVFRVNKRQK